MCRWRLVKHCLRTPSSTSCPANKREKYGQINLRKSTSWLSLANSESQQVKDEDVLRKEMCLKCWCSSKSLESLTMTQQLWTFHGTSVMWNTPWEKPCWHSGIHRFNFPGLNCSGWNEPIVQYLAAFWGKNWNHTHWLGLWAKVSVLGERGDGGNQRTASSCGWVGHVL